MRVTLVSGQFESLTTWMSIWFYKHLFLQHNAKCKIISLKKHTTFTAQVIIKNLQLVKKIFLIKVNVQTDYGHVVIGNMLSILTRDFFSEFWTFSLIINVHKYSIIQFVFKYPTQNMYTTKHVVSDKRQLGLFSMVKLFSFYYSYLPVLETIEFQTI